MRRPTNSSRRDPHQHESECAIINYHLLANESNYQASTKLDNKRLHTYTLTSTLWTKHLCIQHPMGLVLISRRYCYYTYANIHTFPRDASNYLLYITGNPQCRPTHSDDDAAYYIWSLCAMLVNNIYRLTFAVCAR